MHGYDFVSECFLHFKSKKCILFLLLGARPASIFDRKKQNRSEYLKEDKKTIQKAFGQS